MSKRMIARISTQICLALIVFAVFAAVIDPHTMTIPHLLAVIIPALTGIITGRHYLNRTDPH